MSEPMVGIEPTAYPLPWGCSTAELHRHTRKGGVLYQPSYERIWARTHLILGECASFCKNYALNPKSFAATPSSTDCLSVPVNTVSINSK